MSVFLELNITDDHPGLTDRAAPRTHRVGPAGVILDVRGAAALTLHSRHFLFTIDNQCSAAPTHSTERRELCCGVRVVREIYYVLT